MDHGKILKFVTNKTFYFFFHQQIHLISNSNCKKNKTSREKNVLKKINKLLRLRFSVCNWTREGNESFRARHPSGPMSFTQKNKIISCSFFCINHFQNFTMIHLKLFIQKNEYEIILFF